MAQEITIKFHFSYAELVAQVLEKQTFLDRDQAELEPRGVTADRLTRLNDLFTNFRDVTPDEVYLALQTGATQARNDAQRDIGVIMREVAGIAANVLGPKSADYRTLRYDRVATAEAPEFLLLIDTFTDRIEAYLPRFENRGIDEETITNLRSQIAPFQQKIKDVDSAFANRDVATEARRNAANALYDDMANLADIAKVYWESRSEAKYNDYIIYHQSSTAQSRNGMLKAAETKTRELHSMTADTNIIIKNEGEGTLEAYFSQHTDGSPAPHADTGVFVTIEPHEKGTFLAAENLGFNPDIDAIHFTLRNASDDKSLIYRARIE